MKQFLILFIFILLFISCSDKKTAVLWSSNREAVNIAELYNNSNKEYRIVFQYKENLTASFTVCQNLLLWEWWSFWRSPTWPLSLTVWCLSQMFGQSDRGQPWTNPFFLFCNDFGFRALYADSGGESGSVWFRVYLLVFKERFTTKVSRLILLIWFYFYRNLHPLDSGTQLKSNSFPEHIHALEQWFSSQISRIRLEGHHSVI